MKTQELLTSLHCHILWLLSMHEKHAYKIPMLWSKNPFVWSKAQTMHGLSQDVENPTQKAWSASWKTPIRHNQARLQRKTQSSKSHEQPILDHAASVESPVSSDAWSIRTKTIRHKVSTRSRDFLDRRALVRIRKPSLDALSWGYQTLEWQSRILFGAASFAGSREFSRLGTIYRSAPWERQIPSESDGLRQLSRRQTSCPSESMDSSIVSLSSDLPVPSQTRTLEAPHRGNGYSRIDLSTDSQRVGAATRPTAEQDLAPIENHSEVCSDQTPGNVGTRILEKPCLLSRLSSSPVSWSSHNDQHGRIDGSKDSGSHAPLGQYTYARIARTLGDGIYSDESKNGVQW